MATDVRGINLNNLDKMISSIQSYEKKIDAAKITINASLRNNALKGTNVQKDINNLIATIEAKIDEYTNRLATYRARLQEVKAAYKANDNSSSQIFASAASNIKNLKS